MASGRMLQRKIRRFASDGAVPYFITPKALCGAGKFTAFRFWREPPRDGESHVYFMRMGDTGPIKIGYTKRALPRMRLIRFELRPSRLPLTLLSSFPGGRDEEKILHAHFARFNVWREWFYPTPELIELVGAVAVGHFAGVRP